MEPVHVSTNGSAFVHDGDVVVMSTGPRLAKASALLGYILAEYVDGDEAEPNRTDCVEKYVINAMHKHLAYTSKAPRTNGLPTVQDSVRFAPSAKIAASNANV